MGAKPSAITTNVLSLTKDPFHQTDIEIKEEFDNPSHGLTIKCFNNNLKTASNDLMTHQNLKKISKDRYKASSSISVTLASSRFVQRKQNIPQKNIIKENKQNTRRCSIDNNYLAQINVNSGKWAGLFLPQQIQPIQSIKSYIISDNKLFQNYSRAEIKVKDFIKMKKASIRKHYKFIEKIGQGSYGHVYKVKDVKTKQIRAVKSIKQKIMPDDKRNQLIAEIQILKELDHPNIIKLYEVYEDRSMYHVVTEYCMGGSIIDFVVTRKMYSEKVVRTIIQQLLSALNYIHRLKIVHRDLKLQNLVYLNEVNENTDVKDIDVKLIDFGTARKISENFNMCKKLVGTTSYMAPEIINNYFNEKCDIWSTGIILYILLIGRSPFKCASKQQTLRKIKTHELEYTQPQWENVSKPAIDLLRKMLTKDPEKRISASQALSHVWFMEVKSGKNLFIGNKDLVENLSKYYVIINQIQRGNNFISKIESYLTFVKVNQEERKKISEMFRMLDKNNDGTIELEELRIVYDQFEQDQNLEELEYIVSKIDKDKSGRIDLSEFTAAIYDKRKLFVKEYLVEAFDYFDTNGTGYIEKAQLHDLLEGCEKNQIEQILIEIDLNGDNRISKDEFLQYLTKQNFFFQKDEPSRQ